MAKSGARRTGARRRGSQSEPASNDNNGKGEGDVLAEQVRSLNREKETLKGALATERRRADQLERTTGQVADRLDAVIASLKAVLAKP